MKYSMEYVKQWRKTEYEAGRDSSLLAFAIAHEESTRKQAVNMNYRLDLCIQQSINSLPKTT